MKKDLTFTGALFLMIGVVIMLIGALGPNMGSRALAFWGIALFGIIITGIGGAILVIMFSCQGINRFKREKPNLITLIIELLQFLLSCIIYCGGVFLVLVTILSFDLSVAFFVRVIFILIGVSSIVGMVFFRKYRKKHPINLEHVGGVVIMMIPLAMTLFFLYGGIAEGIKLTKDIYQGFPICETVLEEVRPIRKISRKALTQFYLQGINEDGLKTNFQIDRATYNEWKEYCEFDNNQTAVIYYYENTRIVSRLSQ